MLSHDGFNWEKHQELGPAGHDQNDMNVATCFQGIAIVGGGYYTGRIMATRDGQTWSDGELPRGTLSNRSSSPIFGLESIGDTLYLITLRGQVYATHDAKSYEEVAFAKMPTRRHWIRESVQGNGLVVASGDFGPALVFNPKTSEITVTQMAGQVEKLAGFKRVAFGNGVFVVGGQDGLIAMTRSGEEWHNNSVFPERGHVYSVVWTGDHFLASTTKHGAMVSQDGLSWKRKPQQVPRRIVRAGEWLFGWNRRTELSRSRNGVDWEQLPNEREYTVLSVGYGKITGQGDPPKLPAAVEPRRN
jgi:hypothetical protein